MRGWRAAAPSIIASMDQRDQRLIRLYGQSLRSHEQVTRGLSALFQGFWLGVLSREALAQFDELYYRGRKETLAGGNVTYADDEWNGSGLAPWETKLVDSWFGSARRIVVTGAGGGREVLALLERGFDAVGYEPHPELVDAGSRLLESRGHPGRLRSARRDRFPADAEPCDALLVGWGSYMLIPGRARRIAFLRDARDALSAGAPIVLSFFTRPSGGRLTLVSTALANVLRRVRGAERVEPGDGLVPNFTHWFTREEIDRELTEAGFELVHFGEQPYGHAVGRATGADSPPRARAAVQTFSSGS